MLKDLFDVFFSNKTVVSRQNEIPIGPYWEFRMVLPNIFTITLTDIEYRIL